MGIIGALTGTATPPLAAATRLDLHALVLVLAAAVSAGLVGAVIGAWVVRAVGRPRSTTGGSGAEGLRLDLGMRVVSGEHPGLGPRWRHGRAVLKPGSIHLLPFQWGVRLLPQEPVDVHVTAVDRSAGRRSPWRAAFSVAPWALLVPVTTASGAELEVAVVGRSAARALDDVALPPSVSR